MLRLVCSFVFSFGIVGAVLVFVGLDVAKDLERLDPDWEQVTLEQWCTDQTTNRTLFKIDRFEAGDAYLALTDDHSDDFSMVYLPFFRPGERDETGEAAIAVLGIRKAKNDEELEEILSQPFLKIQDYGQSAPVYAKSLSSSCPRINWNKVRWAIVDDELPDKATSQWMILIGGCSIFLSMLSAVAGLFLFKRSLSTVSSMSEDKAAKDLYSLNPAHPHEKSDGSFSSTVLPALGKYSGAIASICLVLGLLTVVLLKTGLVDEEILWPFLFVFSPTFLLTGAFGVFCYFFAKPTLQINSINESELPPKVSQQIQSVSILFERHGFQFVGYAKATFFNMKYHAYLLSPNGQKLAEITVEGGKLSYAVVGVTNDGLVYEAGKCSLQDDLYIDGTSNGVALIADLRNQTDPTKVLAAFNKFSRVLQTQGRVLLEISPASIFHVMHYESILSGWWAYKKSMRFSKPEQIPGVSEVTQDGATFSFCRDRSLDSAFSQTSFQRKSAIEHGYAESSVDDDPAESELYSARFFEPSV